MAIEQIAVSRQTLSEFIKEPFMNKNNTKYLQYEDRYQKYKKIQKIQVLGTTTVNDDFFIHIKVPSESQKGLNYYDVVIQFFTPNEDFKKELTLKNYYVQFFSNSPGFVYKYATLYKLQGYLIESLMDKFQDGVLDILPDKANKNYELFYDSSIYYASRFIIDNRLTLFGKTTYKIYKHKQITKFLEDIQDFDSADTLRQVSHIEKNLLKEIKSDKQLSLQQENKLKKKSSLFHKEISSKREKQHAMLNTFKDKANHSIIKKAKRSTLQGDSSVIIKNKIKPKKYH